MKKLTVFFSVCLLIFVLSGCGSSVSNSTNVNSKPSVITPLGQTPESTPVTATESTPEPAPPVAETTSQKNAVRCRKELFGLYCLLKAGTNRQLEFEGFPNADAVYGADHSGADWKEQAVECAKNYLDYTAFSRQGLIEQLEFEGFSNAEAVYGVDATGL